MSTLFGLKAFWVSTVLFFGFVLDNRFTHKLNAMHDGTVWQQISGDVLSMVYFIAVCFIAILPFYMAELISKESNND